MSLNDTLQSIISSSQSKSSLTEESSSLADDARNIMAALLVRPSADVRHMIELFAPIAEVFLQDLIAGKYPEASLALRAKYASLALGRAGFGPIHNVRALHANLTKEDIEAIKERAVQYVTTHPDSNQVRHDAHVAQLREANTNTSINPTSSEQNQ